MQTQQTDVVVAGGGPTGLALSAALRKAGVDVLTFDRKTDGATESRAAALHARMLEALSELGAPAPRRAGGRGNRPHAFGKRPQRKGLLRDGLRYFV